MSINDQTWCSRNTAFLKRGKMGTFFRMPFCKSNDRDFVISVTGGFCEVPSNGIATSRWTFCTSLTHFFHPSIPSFQPWILWIRPPWACLKIGYPILSTAWPLEGYTPFTDKPIQIIWLLIDRGKTWKTHIPSISPLLAKWTHFSVFSTCSPSLS